MKTEQTKMSVAMVFDAPGLQTVTLAIVQVPMRHEDKEGEWQN